MKVLVLSDIHDHIDNLRVVVEQEKDFVEAVIFCGDFSAPFSSQELATIKKPIYACLGNNDEDQVGLVKMGGEDFVWTCLAEEYGTIELDNRKIAFCHYPRLAELLAKTGEYDAVFHGHTHVVRQEKYEETLLVNPGAVCGIVKGRYVQPSYAVYETSTNEVDIVYY